MKLKKMYISAFIVAASILVIGGCSKMDEYKEFGGGKEKLYSGKPDSVIAYSGKGRVQLSWLRTSDPKVVKTRVFWNNHTDSVELDIVPGDSERLTSMINLPEGNYNFELFNYDAKGNYSVVSRVSGSSYGDVFQKSLFNRSLDNFYARQFNSENNAALSWYASDSKSTGVEVTYKNRSGENVVITSDASSQATYLPGYDLTSPVTYRTMFLPDSSAIDIFYTTPLTVAPGVLLPNQIHLKNGGYPFKSAKTVGRWGTLTDWMTNDAVKNHDGPVGGLDNLNTNTEGYMSFEFWGTPAINDGKVYQTGTLPAGTYRLVVTISNINNTLEDAYVSVAKGIVLPNVSEINSSIAMLKLTNSEMNNKDFTLPFTLTQSEALAIGMAVTMKNVNESSLRIKKFMLFKDL